MVFVRVTVVAPTVPLKVVPPELVIVTVPMSVPMLPPIVTAPVVLMVRFEALPLAVPVTEERLMALAMPVPIVKVAPSARVAAPKVMLPVEAPPTVELPPIVTPVLLSPKVITPVPAAVTVPLTVMALGAVATIPPVKFIVSEPLPKVTVPVLAKVVAPAIVLELPWMATLYAADPAPTVIPVVAVRLPLKVTVLLAVVLVMATVAALTVLLKVVPPELVIVMVPTFVPTAPLTVTAPVVSNVRLALPLDGPVTAVRLIGVAAPAPKVRLLFRAIAPVII